MFFTAWTLKKNIRVPFIKGLQCRKIFKQINAYEDVFGRAALLSGLGIGGIAAGANESKTQLRNFVFNHGCISKTVGGELKRYGVTFSSASFSTCVTAQ